MRIATVFSWCGTILGPDSRLDPAVLFSDPLFHRGTPVTAPIRFCLCVLGLFGSVSGFSQSVNAQQPWEVQSARPTEWHLGGVAFITPQHGFVCGGDRVLMETTNGGQSWAQTASVPRNDALSESPFNRIKFFDALHGYAIGNSPHYRTSDGGQTWQPFTDPCCSMYDLQFVGPLTGFVWSNFSAWKTTDGGDTWTVAWAGYPLMNRIHDMDWFDDQVGVSYGELNGVDGMYRTTDAGGSWELAATGRFMNVRFLNATTLIANDMTTVLRSTDFGSTWTAVFSDLDGFFTDMVDIDVLGADSIVILGNDLRIWVSDDGGSTFTRTQEFKGYWGGLEINFLDNQHGYVAGWYGLMYETHDGGHTWNQMSRGMGVSPADLVMTPAGLGFTVGEIGTIMRTDDFGASWIAMQVLNASNTPPNYLRDIEIIDADSFAIAASDGISYRSDDAGQTWTLPTGGINSYYDYHAVEFVSDQEGWMFGRGALVYTGVIMHTTDGGQTWLRQNPPSSISAIFRAQMLDAQNGWAISTGVMYHTTDGWESWTAIPEPNGNDVLNAFQFADLNTGWVGGFYGSMMKTENGGQSWTAQTLPGIVFGEHYIAEIEAVSPSEAYAVTGSEGWVYHTTDGGSNWTQIDTGFTSFLGANLVALEVLPEGQMWVAGYRGLVLASASDLTVLIPGDINDDGVANMDDVPVFAAVLSGADTDPSHVAASDMNNDGGADGLDVRPFLDAMIP